jgi:hypothetical protein
MRTQDSATLFQHIAKTQYGILATGRQFEGIYYARVNQTDVSSPGAVTAGNMTVVIPALNPNAVWGPMPYPGAYAPPVGTTCSIGFGPNNHPIALAFYGWTYIPPDPDPDPDS